MTDSSPNAGLRFRGSVERDHGPVVDWATDFDLLDADYVVRPERRWAEQRERCPIAFTERRQRTWLPVRYEDLSDIAHDTGRFSSRDIIVASPFEQPINDVLPVPPISSRPAGAHVGAAAAAARFRSDGDRGDDAHHAGVGAQPDR